MRHRLSGRQDDQRELFRDKSDRPRWSELPAGVREAVTSLVAQLLLERSRILGTRGVKGGRHE